jgi:hypothetical protein
MDPITAKLDAVLDKYDKVVRPAVTLAIATGL